MVRIRTVAGGLAGLAVAAGAWTLYQRSTTDTVPYTTVARIDDAELRRYPASVAVETVAPSRNEAFRRLFRYISGANEGDAEIAMTAPVEVADGDAASTGERAARGGGGRKIPMTAPVETVETEAGVRMAFFLPTEYDHESAPRPTDGSVELVAIPERTLAVRRFRWRPTDKRIDREAGRLTASLERAGVATVGDPFYMGYDGPGTLPVLRRNEVAVVVDAD
ncbi:SOUL heme-binding protein [Halosimplex carlsbadense 2-9-1]|uniref:SOUL heme-binding protein n=1 Tax=Halosimplex carlsbadense 2-9-1 TaxID=797114 RepID=M0CC64_9EURY|nr:heme-binding protein [Halosimplex carlsbadense]ELZ19937.1 SOUL heme-binding protein [Halosimplex carlsbadense 2-9-1]